MLLLNYRHLYKAIGWLCKYYKTDVLGLYTGPYLTIVAHSYETTKDSMNEPNFDGKPALPLALLREPEFNSRGIQLGAVFYLYQVKWDMNKRIFFSFFRYFLHRR